LIESEGLYKSKYQKIKPLTSLDNYLPLYISEDPVTNKRSIILNKSPSTLYGELGQYNTEVTASLKD
jgi:hypothetical protein